LTGDQQSLLDKADESYRAAGLLLEHGFLDFAASRSYYAMFYAAEALLLERGLAFTKHAGVISAFGREFVKNGDIPVAYHQYLIQAQDSRHVGDYDIVRKISKDRAQELLEHAELFVKKIVSILESTESE